MKTKHTPGPWWHGPSGPIMEGYSQPFAVAQRGTANLVAGVFGDVRGGKNTAEANARLIAAAPELLTALNLHLEFLKSLPPGWLGKTSGDIGLLNDAYLTGNKALAKVNGTP